MNNHDTTATSGLVQIQNEIHTPQIPFESSTSEITMTTVEIAEKTGKRHGNVIRDTENMLDELYPGGRLKFESTYVDSWNREKKCYVLPKNDILILISGYSIPLRAAIVRRMDELEKRQQFGGLPDFTNPVEAARAWADQQEAAQLAIAERDEAIRTKAQISRKREASAMGTAAAYKRKYLELESKMGLSGDYLQVKGIKWLKDVFALNKVAYQQIGKQLNKLSGIMEYDVEELKDATWGKVKAYHRDVIEEFRETIERNPYFLMNYRKAEVH